MSATQLHYYVTLGQVDPGTWRELLALHGDPTTIMLTADPPDQRYRLYRAWVRLPRGRMFGKHAPSVEEAAQRLIAKLRGDAAHWGPDA